MDLHDVLKTHREEVIQRWATAVRGTLHPVAMPRAALVDHLPLFLDEVIEALRLEEASETSPTAAVHGGQRLELGFNLDGVVREYGALGDAIVDVANARQAPLTARDYRVLSTCITTGIAEAVAQYARQRDAELQRQANEHFAFIAHELRNPLGAALMAVNLLRTKQLFSQERTAQVLDRSLTRMHQLIEESLTSAMLSAGIHVEREAMSLRALLEEAELGASANADAKNIRLSVELASDETIHVDPRLARSAVSNLVRNAVKFTEENGAVVVRGRVADGRVTIEVEDRCGGLAPEKVAEMFAPFVQLDPKKDGFGLGLAIVKQAADAHGGSARVQNLPGKGCIFILELPEAADRA
jgi:signal transduction histidine kinase